ncbi:MAG: prepilin-type N-terminal cleavage/methylation domain-containing protein [Bacilli bacterium]|nr:prepilin-type N-terminal cleavage/methylation domain-containing protein [Bacilli bacterium]
MKKGFTLIELLAVIVILAIIALIAVPTITGIVEKAKKGGARESANGYNDAINKQMSLNLMDNDDTNDINKGIIDAPFDSKYNLKVKGQVPTKGWVEVLKDGVNRYSLVIGEYVVSYDGINNTVVKGTEPNPKPSFATDSWEVIINNVRNGKADVYNLGDTKEVDMGEFGTHTVRIANMSTPSECSTEGFSETACGFVIEFNDIITSHVMNPTTDDNQYGTSKGGWPATSMREYVNSDIYNSLPSDLKMGIIDTKVVSGHGSSDSINFTSMDKLYLLSQKEVYDEFDSSFIYNTDTADSATRQLDYYKKLGVTTSNYSNIGKKNNSNELVRWWLRSACSSNDYIFYFVDISGMRLNHFANTEHNISPAFRIG